MSQKKSLAKEDRRDIMTIMPSRDYLKAVARGYAKEPIIWTPEYKKAIANQPAGTYKDNFKGTVGRWRMVGGLWVTDAKDSENRYGATSTSYVLKGSMNGRQGMRIALYRNDFKKYKTSHDYKLYMELPGIRGQYGILSRMFVKEDMYGPLIFGRVGGFWAKIQETKRKFSETGPDFLLMFCVNRKLQRNDMENNIDMCDEQVRWEEVYTDE